MLSIVLVLISFTTLQTREILFSCNNNTNETVVYPFPHLVRLFAEQLYTPRETTESFKNIRHQETLTAAGYSFHYAASQTNQIPRCTARATTIGIPVGFSQPLLL